ncbi:MAG: hypothetical protein ACYSTS_08590 [Planctomycetota bacterium]|jgi:hypothetical protein
MKNKEFTNKKESIEGFFVRILILLSFLAICLILFFCIKWLSILVVYAIWIIIGLLFSFKFLKKKKSLSLIVTFNIFLLSSLLFCAELGIRILHKEWYRDEWSETLKESDSELGTILKSNSNVRNRRFTLATNYKLEWDVTYHTEADGSRVVSDRPLNGMRFALFGGSFTFGEGLEDKDTIPSKIQKEFPTYRIFNYGVTGHGTAQNYLYFKRIMSKHPDTKLCMVGFIHDHVRRTELPYELIASNWAKLHPKVRVIDGKITNLGRGYNTLSFIQKVHVNLLSRVRIYLKLFSTEYTPLKKDWDLVGKLIVAMNNHCNSINKHFVLVCLPSIDEDETNLYEDFIKWKTLLQYQGVLVVDLIEQFDNYIKKEKSQRSQYFFNDGHPNKKYASVIAELISNSIKEHFF